MLVLVVMAPCASGAVVLDCVRLDEPSWLTVLDEVVEDPSWLTVVSDDVWLYEPS